MEVKCKLCMEAFQNELNLVLHFKQSHLDSDYSEDEDSLASDSGDNEEVSEDESEQCEYNKFMSFLTDFEKDLLHSAYSVAEEEGFLSVDDSSMPSSNDIKDEEWNHQEQLDPNSFITDYEWRLLESSSSKAEAEGIEKVEEELLEEGRNCSQITASHNEENAEIDQDPVSSTGIRRKLPVRRCKQAIPEQRSPLEKVRQLLPRFKPTQKEQLESHAETEAEEDDDDRKFKCHFKGCDKSFSRNHDLNRHLKLHKTKPHMCAICKRHFVTPYLLEVHMLTHSESGKLNLECEICHKRFSKLRYLQTHKIIHSKLNPYVCSQCQKVFSQKSHLAEHMKTHSKSSADQLQCDLCDHLFASRNLLTKHKNVHKRVSLPCALCDKKFVRMTHLKLHELKSHGQPVERNGERYTNSCTKMEDLDTDDEEVPLVIVQKTETGGRDQLFKCNVEGCDKAYKQRHTLNEHLYKTHKVTSIYKCGRCGKGFPDRQKLIVHMKSKGHRVIDQAVKISTCFECGEQFEKLPNLNNHTLSHMKLRGGKFGCQKCDKWFARKAGLIVHMKQAHRKPDLGSSNDDDDTTDDSSM